MNYYLILLIPLIHAQTLLLAIEYGRHGARHSGDDKYDWIKGRRYILTEAGMRQHYILGQMLRKRYIDEKKLLSEHYTPEELLVNASYSTRTLVSAQSQITGLYNLGTGNKIDESTAIRAIPPNG